MQPLAVKKNQLIFFLLFLTEIEGNLLDRKLYF